MTRCCILIIAHAPLASALSLVVQHTLCERRSDLLVVDVEPTSDREPYVSRCLAMLRPGRWDGVLLLTDLWGATPARVAADVAERLSVASCIVTGVHPGMLLPLLGGEAMQSDFRELARSARSEGRRWILQIDGEEIVEVETP